VSIPSKSQVQKLLQDKGIPGEVRGSGANWEVELPDEKAQKAFSKLVPGVGGYKTGYGAWIMKPGYKDRGDPNDPSSRHHYAKAETVVRRFLATSVTSKLMSRQEKILKDYRAGGGKVMDYDDLPANVRAALSKVKDQETLWSDVNRWLGDNR